LVSSSSSLPALELGRASRAIRRRRARARRRLLSGALALVLAGTLLVVGRASAELRPSTIAYWDGVARCETGGRVDYGAGHPGWTWSGYVGFARSTWREWAGELGLVGRYPLPELAPRLVQIRVADYGRRVHAGYWGCA
jgi:hypothetical protein